MPERGWAILTVREATARMVKEIAHNRGLTVDELIIGLISPSGKAGWSSCSICGARVKSTNLREHVLNVHPKTLTSQKMR
jgi:hypothetical protein